jgi:hypothetical protein
VFLTAQQQSAKALNEKTNRSEEEEEKEELTTL